MRAFMSEGFGGRRHADEALGYYPGSGIMPAGIKVFDFADSAALPAKAESEARRIVAETEREGYPVQASWRQEPWAAARFVMNTPFRTALAEALAAFVEG